MILHIIDDEKFLQSAIKLFESIFPGNNKFLVGIDRVGYNDFEQLKKSTFIVCEQISTSNYKNEYDSLAKNAKLIMFHNIYKEYKLELLKSDSSKIKKVWYLWGAEIYGLNPKFNTLLPLTKTAYHRSLSLKSFVRKVYLSYLKKMYYWAVFKKLLRQNKIDYVLTNITEDIEQLESFVNCKTKRAWFTYFIYDESQKYCTVDQKCNIMIGNSSSETNNHLDAFKLIEKKCARFKSIFIPLNYGDHKYSLLVKKQGKEIFDNQIVFIDTFLSIEDFKSMINSCSVIIMNHKRQQAFNTIMISLANGCKVFLREENTIFKMLKREGFIVFSIQNDIDKDDAFNSLELAQQEFNLSLIKEKYSKKFVYRRIKDEFERLMNE